MEFLFSHTCNISSLTNTTIFDSRQNAKHMEKFHELDPKIQGRITACSTVVSRI